MADYRPPTRDIFFVLDHLVDVGALARLERFAHVELDTVKDVLEENGRFMAEVLAPLDRVGDQEGAVHDPSSGAVTMPPGFKEAYASYVEAGWPGVPFDPVYGGGGFPWLVAIVTQELMTSANMAFALGPVLTQGAIDMLSQHGSEAQRERYLPKMVTGEWTGTMNLTEPQAGSDLGAIRTRAVRRDDGTYLISGTKIFITYGEHDMAENIVHLVLARTPDSPPGTKGISCFMVPKRLVGDDGELGERNDVKCLGIERKMGIHASPTCVMSYGEGEGAIGELVGEEHQGMRYMFTMMNTARLLVGLQGLAVAERAYQDAYAYACERRQGRALGGPPGEQVPIVEHPDVRRMLLTMRSLVEAMRGLVYTCAEASDLATNHSDPTIRESRQARLDLLIPVAKAWSTEMGSEVASIAIQVLGGMGYIEESGVPQHYRDVRIAAIYEGTNGIQALDLVGRKLPMEGGRAMQAFLADVAAVVAELRSADGDLGSLGDRLASASDVLERSTAWLAEAGGVELSDVLAGATPYLRMFGLVAGGWVMGRQALAAHAASAGATGDEVEFLAAKVSTARFFTEQLLPAVHGLEPAVTAGAGGLFEAGAEALAW